MSEAQSGRRLLLDAATVEFAEVGIAGGRVDRIAAAAKVNKSQIYYYFGSKDGLFDAVLSDNLERILDAVPLTAHDLPGYAARLYDSYVERPEFLRLATWYRLEKVPEGDLFGSHDESKLGAVVAAQRDGSVDATLGPAEVISVVTAIAMTWSPVNVTYAAGADDAEAEHARRRRVIASTVSRSLVPGNYVAS